MTEYGTYTVTGDQPVQDAKTGEAIAPGKQVRLPRQLGRELAFLGVVKAGEADVEPEKVTCPQCEALDRSRPFKTASDEELADHYADKHPAFAAPTVEELRNG